MEVAKCNVPMRAWDGALMLLVKCWETNMAFLFPLKINYSNLTAKHMWTSERKDACSANVSRLAAACPLRKVAGV